MSPPIVVMCQNQRWNNGQIENENANISDKDWFFKQFNMLNDKINICLGDGVKYRYINLSDGF